MATNKIFTFGPIALTSTLTTNILNPAISSLAGPTGFTMTQPYIVLRHIRIVNKLGAGGTVSFWLGASGANTAGTEVIGTGLPIAANAAYDWYGIIRLDSTQYLVGGASQNSQFTIYGGGEIGVSG